MHNSGTCAKKNDHEKPFRFAFYISRIIIYHLQQIQAAVRKLLPAFGGFRLFFFIASARLFIVRTGGERSALLLMGATASFRSNIKVINFYSPKDFSVGFFLDIWRLTAA